MGRICFCGTLGRDACIVAGRLWGRRLPLLVRGFGCVRVSCIVAGRLIGSTTAPHACIVWQEDFGGHDCPSHGHADPNLANARELCDRMGVSKEGLPITGQAQVICTHPSPLCAHPPCIHPCSPVSKQGVLIIGHTHSHHWSYALMRTAPLTVSRPWSLWVTLTLVAPGLSDRPGRLALLLPVALVSPGHCDAHRPWSLQRSSPRAALTLITLTHGYVSL